MELLQSEYYLMKYSKYGGCSQNNMKYTESSLKNNVCIICSNYHN